MKLRLIKLRDTLADSFWFLPAVMAFLAGGLALGSVAFDQAIGSGWVKNIGWVWSGGADGARSVLSTVAGSVMTVVSIVFSLTITTLAQTSSHYGPRVLRNFTSDRRVQFTLGTFISTFVYCLLVLRTIRSVQESSFVPYLSVTIGVVLALFSLAVLIFFIHHVSQSIQAENLIAEVGENFQAMLSTFFPERNTEKDDRPNPPETRDWKDARAVNSPKSGYLQRQDEEALLDIAKRHDLYLKLEKRSGEFVGRNTPLLQALPAGRVTDEIERGLRECFSLGNHRTPYQDALYSIQQLVEIAAHALSPGINEPFTAVTCVDWLGTSLRGIIRREFPSTERLDEQGRVRVLIPELTFGEVAQVSFEQIRIYGASNPAISIQLLDTIASLAPDLHREADRKALWHHAQFIGGRLGQGGQRKRPGAGGGTSAPHTDRVGIETVLRHFTLEPPTPCKIVGERQQEQQEEPGQPRPGEHANHSLGVVDLHEHQDDERGLGDGNPEGKHRVDQRAQGHLCADGREDQQDNQADVNEIERAQFGACFGGHRIGPF